MERGFVQDSAMKEGVAKIWKIGSANVMWLNVGKLAFACHTTIDFEEVWKESCYEVMAS